MQRGQIVRGKANLVITIPPGAEAHKIVLSVPFGRGTRYDGIVAQSSFQRACAILNARFFSESDVYFSYCHKLGSINFYSDSTGDFQFYSKKFFFFSKPGFNPKNISVLIESGLARERLEDPNFILRGTNEAYDPLWEPPFDGGQRADVFVDYQREESFPMIVKDLETQRIEALPEKNSVEKFYEEKYLPVTEKITKFAQWLQKKE